MGKDADFSEQESSFQKFVMEVLANQSRHKAMTIPEMLEFYNEIVSKFSPLLLPQAIAKKDALALKSNDLIEQSPFLQALIEEKPNIKRDPDYLKFILSLAESEIDTNVVSVDPPAQVAKYSPVRLLGYKSLKAFYHQIVCLECCHISKMLTARHLATHSLNAKTYRMLWRIPESNPLMCEETIVMKRISFSKGHEGMKNYNKNKKKE